MNMTIPGKVFCDLGFEKILPESTISRLAVLPAVDEIQKRQEIFRRLENDAYLDAFRKLREGLGELTSAERRFRASEGNIERMFSLAELTRVYGECAKLLSTVDGFADNTKASLIDVSGQLAELSERLERIDEFELTLHTSSFVTETDERESFIGELRRLESALGLSATARPRLAIRLGTLDARLSELFGEAVVFDAPEAFMDAVDQLTGLVGDVDFFLNINELVDAAKAKSIPVCYPEIAAERVFCADDLSDITLISETTIVPNDVRLDTDEPLCFIIGANGGGKTSFLRAVGVNLILFLNGAPVFARSASIYPFRSVLTHFPVGEPEISTGRFEEERARADEIIESAGRESFVLFNETYSGTNEEKGCASALDAAKRIVVRGAFGLFVTHFAGVAYSGFGLLRAVVGDGGERTYRIVKSEQSGSYALDILRKYKIAPEQLVAREASDEI